MADRNSLTAVEARRLLKYNRRSGLFRWRIKPSGNIAVGDIAGSGTYGGYVVITIEGVAHYAHRLAVLIVTGDWPKGEVDHWDGIGFHNAWSNLRDVDHATNSQNRNRPNRNNTSGFLGVTFVKASGLWRAQIKIKRKNHNLGDFAIAQDASNAYQAARAGKTQGERRAFL